MSNFNVAVRHVLRIEREWADHPDDPGKKTKWGFTERDNPDIDLESFTEADAVERYKQKWDKYGLDGLHYPLVASKLFDMMVNLGDETAIRLAQRAVNYLVPKPIEIETDGLLGPKTLQALNSIDPQLMVLALSAYHAARYIQLVEGPDIRFETFSKGWLRRALTP